MRITFLAPRIYPVLFPNAQSRSAGGAETQQVRIIHQLANCGLDISVVCYAPQDFAVQELSPRVSVYPIRNAEARGVPGLRFLYPNLTDSVAAIVATKPDLIYQRVAGLATGAAAFAATRCGVPFIYACASDLEFRDGARGLISESRARLVFRAGLMRADRILLQNATQVRLAKTARLKRASLVPNLIEIPAASSSRGDFLSGPILWVGSIQKVKRPDVFICIAKRCPQWQFHMICSSTGDSHREQPFQLLLQEAMHLPNLKISGFVEPKNLPRFYQEASLLVSTSDSEGFPNTFLEAWSHSLPVLSFVDPRIDESPMPQLVVGSTDEMIDAINRIMNTPSLRSAMSEASLAYVKAQHSVQVVVPKYLALFEELISSGSTTTLKQ